MGEVLRLFILAGEPSGERLAVDLVKRLRSRVPVEISGVGGAALKAEGLQPIFPMSDLSVMGIQDVLGRLPRLLWRVEQTARAILKTAPDVTVLVDSQVFVQLVAKRLRARGFSKPVLLYVAPSVWGRAPERARKLRPLFDEVLAILPFEPKVMADLGGPPTHYVGHSALAEAQVYPAGNGDAVVLLPGSRAGELRRHLPLMRATAEALFLHAGIGRFVLPTLPELQAGIQQETGRWTVPVDVTADRGARHRIYADAQFAVVAAGTATLELALANVPMVVTFRMEKAQAWHYERLQHPLVSLPNIVLSRKVVPEILLSTDDPAPLISAALELCRSPEARQAQRDAFGDLRDVMRGGLPGVPREDPADRVLAHARKRSV